MFPHWAPSLLKTAVIGAHIFYRWTGGWGTPAAFRQAYAGVEPLPGPKPPQLVALPVSGEPTTIQAEIAAVMAASQYAAAKSAPAPAPAPEPPLANSGRPLSEPEKSHLPDSQVLEVWRYSGMPRDQLPADVR